MLMEKTVNDFVNEVASSAPAPGGGSVAALAGTLGAALTVMVCNLTIGRKKYASVQVEMESVLKRAEGLRKELASLVDEDTRAFTDFMAAVNLPKGTEEEQRRRSDAMQRGTMKATTIPLRVMELCEEALSCAGVAAERGNVNSISDAGVAVLLLHAACTGALLNVRTNLRSLGDHPFARESSARAEAIARRAGALYDGAMNHVNASISPEASDKE